MDLNYYLLGFTACRVRRAALFLKFSPVGTAVPPRCDTSLSTHGRRGEQQARWARTSQVSGMYLCECRTHSVVSSTNTCRAHVERRFVTSGALWLRAGYPVHDILKIKRMAAVDANGHTQVSAPPMISRATQLTSPRSAAAQRVLRCLWRIRGEHAVPPIQRDVDSLPRGQRPAVIRHQDDGGVASFSSRETTGRRRQDEHIHKCTALVCGACHMGARPAECAVLLGRMAPAAATQIVCFGQWKGGVTMVSVHEH